MARRAVKVIPGTQPEPDSTNLKTVRYVSTDKVYFDGDALTTYPGWQLLNSAVTGAIRSVFGFNNATFNIYLIGTHEGLTARINGVETNITPLQASPAATLAADPLATALGDTTLTVTYAAHGLTAGQRIKLDGATDVGGITAATDIDREFIVATVPDANTFTVTMDVAASSAATGGGSAVDIYKQLAAGNISGGALSGFGGGTYSSGGDVYGIGYPFVAAFSYPRIWSFGKYGNDVVICPGDNGIIYQWDGNVLIAPAPVTDAPTANWIYTKNNAIGALGAASVGNNIAHSDTEDTTAWTPAPDNNAFEDVWEEAGRFISQAASRDVSLLFTESEVVAEEFRGQPDGYVHKTIMKSDGILGPMARIEVEDAIFWTGAYDFYVFDGSTIAKLEGITCHDYIFKNLNFNQRYKCFWEYDVSNNFLVFHFPTGAASEPNEYMVYDLTNKTSTLGTRDLTAAEQSPLGQNRITAYGDGTTHLLHEENSGNDAGDIAMNWHAESHWRMLGDGSITQEIMEIYPDSIQTGNISLTIYTKNYVQDVNQFTYGPYVVTPTTPFIDPQAEGVYVKYRWEGNSLGGYYRGGAWAEDVQPGTAP